MRKIVKFLFVLCFIPALSAQEVIVASYNIRYLNSVDYDEGNGWSDRVSAISDLIRFYDFEMIGMQEVTDKQLQDLLISLNQYKSVGCARDDGEKAGEYSPILYNSAKIKAVSSGTFWLSDSTDVPSVGWDARKPRICTWGHFAKLDNGQDIWMFNTHFDHRGVEARNKSAELILKKIREITPQNAMIILTGDFNADQNSMPYQIIESSKVLKDAFSVARFRYANNGTFNNFNINRKTVERIDHIFVSTNIDVVKYGILTDVYWTQNSSADYTAKQKIEPKFPSDHFPLMIIVQSR